MAKVLTEASTVLCGTDAPASHGGNVAKTGSQKLKVSGNGVLVATLATGIGPSVSGCKTPDDSAHSLIPCKSVTSITSGQSTKLFAGGLAAALETLHGVTLGTPPGSLSASAGQTKLMAS